MSDSILGPAQSMAAKGRAPAGSSDQALLREGDYWSILFDGQLVRLRDSKGMRYLAELLRRPGEPVAATILVTLSRRPAQPGRSDGRRARPTAAPRADTPREAERARLSVTKAIKSALVRVAFELPELGDHLEATIHRGYACRYTPDPRHRTIWDVVV